jgi:hypothetical protein
LDGINTCEVGSDWRTGVAGCIVSKANKMPFMKGKAPIRRTLKYLEAGSLVLKERIKIFCINYNHHGNHHRGARYVLFQASVLYIHIENFGCDERHVKYKIQ